MTIDPEQLFVDYDARLDAVTRKAEQITAGLARVSVTERSEDGQVAVTVDARGNVTDLRIAQGRQGPELAQLVMATMRRAQSRLGDAVRQTVPDVGDDLLTDMTEVYRRTYPAPQQAEKPRRTLRLGPDPDAAPDNTPRRRPAPGGDTDDTDYADRGLLR
jgi:DNA-binding protein YbaB